MKNNVKVLDCTLRDGGFLNDWHFGKECIINIFDRLCLSGADIIEVGYLRDYVNYDINASQYSCTADINRVIPTKNPSFNGIVVAIIDYGNCKIENVACKNESVLDGIRVTFKKNEIAEAMDFCLKIKEKGYKVFLQPVSVTDYSDREVLDLVDEANRVEPYALYIVDTYGFMHKKDLIRYWSLLNDNLKEGIRIGYHAHNNFQLAYANAIELMEINTDRIICIDSSAFGMGKGAGNANTELVMLYLNENFKTNYDIDQILEIVDIYINKERSKHFWGYTLAYYIAAYNDCHPEYVRYLVTKKTLSIKSINEILSKIEKNKKTKFDVDYIEKKYLEYQSVHIDDSVSLKILKEILIGRNILIIAPGNSVHREIKKLKDFIKEKKPVMITVNHISEIDCDIVFISSAKRYSLVSCMIGQNKILPKVMLTSNITETSLKSNITINYKSAMGDYSSDNSMIMLINTLIKLGIPSINTAGFDGYSGEIADYAENVYNFNDEGVSLSEKNRQIDEILSLQSSHIKINFLTPSNYQVSLKDAK